jgi:hypothetical protein
MNRAMARMLSPLVGGLWLVAALVGAVHAQDATPAAAATAAPVENAAQVPAAPPTLTADQLDQLCGPVALYPDPLLAQILIASAYPLDVVQAARWAEANKDKKLTPEALEAALKDKQWDASVKVCCAGCCSRRAKGTGGEAAAIPER